LPSGQWLVCPLQILANSGIAIADTGLDLCEIKAMSRAAAAQLQPAMITTRIRT
jgi:hypothetical protein